MQGEGCQKAALSHDGALDRVMTKRNVCFAEMQEIAKYIKKYIEGTYRIVEISRV